MKYLWLVLLLCGCGTVDTQNQAVGKAKFACTFFDEFIDNGDGTVSDSRNGLIWKRCAEGQNWDGNVCVGKGVALTLSDALTMAEKSRFLGKETWRLPSKNEFEKILGARCQDNNWKSGEYAASAMIANPVVPNGSAGKFWTPQTIVGNYDSLLCGKEVAYVANFSNGRLSPDFEFTKCGGVNVRLVRSSTVEEQAALSNKFAIKKQVQADRIAQVSKIEQEKRISQMKDGIIGCAAATIPSSRPLPYESVDYYGECSGGNATTGVVIRKIRSEPVDIQCLSQGAYVSINTVDAFKSCNTYLPLIPNYCSMTGYVGQCVNAKPQGVGYMTTRGATLVMKRGMFRDGNLQGYGYEISKGGCGPAGCSGNFLNQTGWFDGGIFQASCKDFVDCLENISGKIYSDFLSMPKSATQMTEVERLRTLKTFDGFMEAFQIAGDRADLRTAQTMAHSAGQKSRLELMLFRIAGLDKVFELRAQVQIGRQTVPINEHEHLLGFVRGVDSSLPVKIIWSIGSSNAALRPRLGPYRLRVTVGLNVATSRRICFMNFCNDLQDVDRYARSVDAVVVANNRYQASGDFDFTLSGASAGTMFGASNGKKLENIFPVMKIESIRVEP